MEPCHRHFSTLLEWAIREKPAVTMVTTVALLVLFKEQKLVVLPAVALLCRFYQRWRHIPHYILKVPPPAVQQLYTPGGCGSASLFYEGSMPVLEMHCDAPFDRGYAHGFLLSKQITELFFYVIKPMQLLLKLNALGAKSYRNLTIPNDAKAELKGVIAGLQSQGCSLTYEELLSAHVMTDIFKKSFYSLGCSGVILKRGDEVCLGRNLDWISINKLGAYSLTIRHRSLNLLTFPGYIGALTGHNGSLKFFVNECGGVSKEIGTPYNLFMAKLVRESWTVKDVTDRIKLCSPAELPASSCNITVLDHKGDAKTFQFYAEEGKAYTSRRLTKFGDCEALVVTNHAEKEGEMIAETASVSSSEPRAEEIRLALQRDLPLKDRVIAALSHEKVNRFTVHSMIFHGSTTEYVFDNFRASRKLLGSQREA